MKHKKETPSSGGRRPRDAISGGVTDINIDNVVTDVKSFKRQ